MNSKETTQAAWKDRGWGITWEKAKGQPQPCSQQQRRLCWDRLSFPVWWGKGAYTWILKERARLDLERDAHGQERPPGEVCTARDLRLMLNSVAC